MHNERRPRFELGKQDPSTGRGRSSSPSLFFKSSSSSNLLRLRKAHSPSKEPRSTSSSRATLDSLVCNKEQNSASSSSSNMMVDVLPSFELYNTLHRHIPQGNVNPDLHDYPPTYQEVQSRAPTLTPDSHETTTVANASSTSVDSTAHGGRSSISGDQLLNLEALSTLHEPIQDDLGDSDNIYIDKLYSLPKLTTPIEISIRVTKEPAVADRKVDDESILKEYTSGDIIHGYVVIENRSTQRQKFEMFYVTLEGRATSVDRECGKRTVKRFLRMVDISASWSYSNIDVSNGVSYVPGRRDFENCVIGLNNNRVLEPHVRYKKYFMFKLPTHLLDVSCKHQQFSHCLVPPAFGIDVTKASGKYSSIKVNPMLGYGHLGTKGSPILTNDLSTEDVSINYTIDTKVVGKDSKSKKLNILKEREYNLRFIPFGFCRPFSGERAPLNQLQDMSKLIQERIEALKKVFKRLDTNECITSEDLHNTDISGTAVDPTDVDSEDIMRRKLDQLYVSNRVDPVCSSFPLRSSKINKDKDKKVEVEFKYNYKDKQKSANKLKKGIFGSFGPSTQSHSTQPTSSNKSGIIIITSKIPKRGLPYVEPSLLKKTNKLESKSEQNQENWYNLQASLPDKEKEILSSFDIGLRCIQANNCKSHLPPQIQTVTTELICITAKSINSIPIKLNADLLLKKERLDDIQKVFKAFKAEMVELKAKFDENFEQLNELFSKSRRSSIHQELKFTDFLSEQLMTNIESICTLRTDVRSLHNIFKKQSQTLENDDKISDSAPNKSASTASILSNTFSGSSSNSSVHTSTAEKLKNQLLHEWVKTGDGEYERTVTVNLHMNDDIKETLIPTFESCLISRLYCIRVNIKFEGQLGVATVDVPVQIRMLEP
ncbi:ubiquitin-ubiquitin ligase BUL2 [Lachancea thermotolerans CBS 6340]|uniref:KLTH0C04004p n=1 Tax=Lachancea thermotolerans (strain ATCC 56472 / CBS 6340 / NRRL Y-8284) TaxID=559295 RepID=C5DDV1_LACTC|nr:KLTH0C04004p [Lachancea thermotolerans CBS 6340]CAR21962.1 KLTH0C04004p [Lachancea thermotolerans CBS 6340]